MAGFDELRAFLNKDVNLLSAGRRSHRHTQAGHQFQPYQRPLSPPPGTSRPRSFLKKSYIFVICAKLKASSCVKAADDGFTISYEHSTATSLMQPSPHIIPPPPPQLNGPPLRPRQSPPPFPETYGGLLGLRLPSVTLRAASRNTTPYSDVSPAPNPPRFMYPDSGLGDEVKARFETVIRIMGVENRPCPPEARPHWNTMCKSMVENSYKSEDWTSAVGHDLLRIVLILLQDALGSIAGWDPGAVSWMDPHPELKNSQKGDRYGAVKYNGHCISALACEWKTTKVLDMHAKDLGSAQVLYGGQITNGRAMAKKIGLQQASISKKHNVDVRYGTIFTGSKMVVTSQAVTIIDGRSLLGVRVSSALELCGPSGVSAVAFFFGLLTPAQVLAYDALPNPESISTVWLMLQPLLRKALSTDFMGTSGHEDSKGGNTDGGPGAGSQGSAGQSRGKGGRGGGRSGRQGPSSSTGGASSHGQQYSHNAPSGSYYDYGSFPSMTMRHSGMLGVFNPTRKLVAVTPAWLAEQESLAVSSEDSSSDTNESSDSTQENAVSTAPTSPELTDSCLPLLEDDSAHFDDAAHIEILKEIPAGFNAEVLSASLIIEGGIPFPVILKVVHEHNFPFVANEVAAYCQLARLRVVVPQLIALMAPAHEQGWVMMVIENAGEPIGRDGEDWDNVLLTASEKLAIYLALLQIHAEDFGLATVDHKCERESCEELGYLRTALGLEGTGDATAMMSQLGNNVITTDCMWSEILRVRLARTWWLTRRDGDCNLNVKAKPDLVFKGVIGARATAFKFQRTSSSIPGGFVGASEGISSGHDHRHAYWNTSSLGNSTGLLPTAAQLLLDLCGLCPLLRGSSSPSEWSRVQTFVRVPAMLLWFPVINGLLNSIAIRSFFAASTVASITGFSMPAIASGYGELHPLQHPTLISAPIMPTVAGRCRGLLAKLASSQASTVVSSAAFRSANACRRRRLSRPTCQTWSIPDFRRHASILRYLSPMIPAVASDYGELRPKLGHKLTVIVTHLQWSPPLLSVLLMPAVAGGCRDLRAKLGQYPTFVVTQGIPTLLLPVDPAVASGNGELHAKLGQNPTIIVT
ncbi:hypothetical protein GGX14DRAFT_409239 [Mycena pura]|uniref:Uncharacterized protein n=1 Tax=Mycena pura TaxID=153505 RepID=A0AAD6ULD2_9AGAR|nr:hypothetical protein GGX14DRAFT_409239 [Mycena pura]